MTRKKTEKQDPSAPQERLVSIRRSLPPSYTHVRKGDVYVTRNCRKKTLATDQPLFVVHAHDQPHKILGLRVPTPIARAVFADAAATKESRASAVKAKDTRDEENAKIVLDRLYPRLPTNLSRVILDHAFAKYSGRVGRTGRLDLQTKIRLAVQAHARHRHTKYDSLLKTSDRESARTNVRNEVEKTIRGWSRIQKVESRENKTSRSKPNGADRLKKVKGSQSGVHKRKVAIQHKSTTVSRRRSVPRKTAILARSIIRRGLESS